MKAALGVALVALTVPGCAGDAGDAVESRPIISQAPAVASPPTSADEGSTITGSSGSATTVTGRQPQGFTTVTLGLSGTDVCCVWLADSPDERRRGLMEVTDLGAPVGMLFAYTGEQQGSFYMFNTLLPLSIAFFDDEGRFVSSTDMEPCRSADPADCARYVADAPYRYALEVPKGALDDLGIGRGTTIVPGAEGCS